MVLTDSSANNLSMSKNAALFETRMAGYYLAENAVVVGTVATKVGNQLFSYWKIKLFNP